MDTHIIVTQFCNSNLAKLNIYITDSSWRPSDTMLKATGTCYISINSKAFSMLSGVESYFTGNLHNAGSGIWYMFGFIRSASTQITLRWTEDNPNTFTWNIFNSNDNGTQIVE